MSIKDKLEVNNSFKKEISDRGTQFNIEVEIKTSINVQDEKDRRRAEFLMNYYTQEFLEDILKTYESDEE